MLLSLARNIVRADATLKGGTWDRKNLEGVELYNKTLGICMAPDRRELSRRAIAFGMRVVAFDSHCVGIAARSPKSSWWKISMVAPSR